MSRTHGIDLPSAVNRILRAALVSADEEEIGLTCLEMAEAVTSSPFGFIGGISPDGQLYTIAISNPGMTACEESELPGHRGKKEDFAVAGLYGRVLTMGKPYLTNDPANDEHRAGTPKAHPPLTAFLGVPLLSQGEVVGLVGVANRSGGYSRQEQDALESLAPSMTEAFQRFRAEAAVAETARLAHGLNRIEETVYASFDVELIAQKALEVGAEILGADMAALSRYEPPITRVTNSFGFDRDISGTVIDASPKSLIVVAIESRTPVVVEDTRTDRRVDVQALAGFDTRALIAVPLIAGGETLGLIYYNYRRPRSFSEAELDFARRLSSALSLAIENARLFASEKAANIVNREILESISDAFFALDRDFRFTYVNEKAAELIRHTPEELIHQNLWEVYPEAVGTAFDEQYHKAMQDRVTARFETFYPPFGIWYEVRAYPSADGISVYFTDVTEQKRGRELSDALNRVDSAVTSTLDHDQILQRVVEEAAGVMDVDLIAVVERDGEVWRTAWPKSADGTPLGVPPRASSIADIVANTCRPFILTDLETEPSLASLDGGSVDLHAAFALPLTVRDEIVGVLAFVSRRPMTFTAAELDFGTKLASDVSLALQNARLYRSQREIANRLQESLVAMPESLPGTEFAHEYHSATEAAFVGGDFYDVFELDHDRVGITIGDISGKGIEAAVLTSLVKNTIRAHAIEKGKTPELILTLTNEVVYRATPTEAFATVFFAILDCRDGRLAYANAGHTTAAIVRQDGTVSRLPVTGPLLGAFAEAAFEQSEAWLELNELLFLYTDGLTEARRNGELYGEGRVFAYLATTKDGSVREIVKHAIDRVLSFTGDRLRDDLAILAVRRLEPRAEAPQQKVEM